MAISRNLTTLSEQATGTSLAVTVPGFLQDGDVLVCHVVTSDTAAGPTLPADWVLIGFRDQGGVNQSQGSYHVVTDAGSEPGTYTWTAITTGRSSGIMTAYRGVDNATPIDVAASVFSVNSGGSLALPTITTVTDGARLLQGLGGDASVALWTPPAGTETIKKSTDAIGRSAVYGDEIDATAGVTGSRTWTVSFGTAITGWMGALRPDADYAPGGKYLNENGTDRFLLEDGSGVLLMEGDAPSSGVSVNAEAIAGTGAATNAAASIAATATAASGTGAATNAAALLAASAGSASGTGAAGGATSIVAPTAGAASGTGAASNATVVTAITANAEGASGTGAASDVTAAVAPTAIPAAGAGTASGANSAQDASAIPASGTGAASDATVDTVVFTDAQAEAASGTGEASGATTAIATGAEAAGGTGAAGGPSSAVAVSAIEASGSGAASDATVSTAADVNVNAEAAAGSGTATDVTASVAPTAQAATGTGAATDATVSVASDVSVNAEPASGTGAASDPSVSLATGAIGASGTGAAGGSTSSIAVGAIPASGTGAASDAIAQSGNFTLAQAQPATGSGTASDATVTAVDGAVGVGRGPSGGRAPSGRPRFGRLEFEIERGRKRVTHPSAASLTPLPLRPIEFRPRIRQDGQAEALEALGEGAAQDASAEIGTSVEAAVGRGSASDATVVVVNHADPRYLLLLEVA